jgi:hypothetical protein
MCGALVSWLNKTLIILIVDATNTALLSIPLAAPNGPSARERRFEFRFLELKMMIFFFW